MDAEYRDLLLAAEKRYQTSWYSYSIELSFTALRIICVVSAKAIFVIRDTMILLLNVLYIILLAPLDLVLIGVYFSAVNIRPDHQEDPDDLRYDPHKKAKVQSGSMADLNIIRRLFWSGSNVAIGKNLMTLSIPQSIYTKDTILEGDQPNLEQQWRNKQVINQSPAMLNKNRKHRQNHELPINEDLKTEDFTTVNCSDYMKSPQHSSEESSESPKHKFHYGKRVFNNSRTQNLFYFLTRPNDTKSLESYTKIVGKPPRRKKY